MKKNKSFLSRLFSHNITLLILAFLISFSAWFIIKISSGDDSTREIKDIKVTIDLPETAKSEGMKWFVENGDNDVTVGDGDSSDNTNKTVSVTVTGNPLTIGRLSSSDIKVSASQITTILNPGPYELPLTAKKATLKSDYDFEIGELSESTIKFYVDVEKEQTFTVEDMTSKSLKDENHFSSVSMSPDKITVYGPQTLVNKIKKVAIKGTLETDSQLTLMEKIVYLDENDNELDLDYVTADYAAVEVTVSVQPAIEVALDVDVINAPENFPEITIEPSTLKITGSQESLNTIKNNTVSLGELDFASLKNSENEIIMDIKLPDGCKPTDNTSESTKKAKVYIDLSSYDSVMLNAKITTENLDTSKYSTDLGDSKVISVTVYGPAEDLAELSSSDITVTADFAGLTAGITDTKAVNVPLQAWLSDDFSGTCWCAELPTFNGVNVTKK